MQIDEKTIDRVAELARLEFNTEEKAEIKNDLNRILQFVDKLNELDTENVAPLVFMTDEVNATRPDEVKLEITQAEALKNAPQKDAFYFKLPKVLDSGK